MIKDAFQKSLKPRAIEELLDYYFYRRLAMLFVPLFIRFKISPNQITTLSLICGLIAGLLLFHYYFFAAAMMAILAICFDCCDGQVARLTGKTHPLGRVMDGFFDLVWVAFYWAMLYFSDYFQSHNMSIFWLFLLSAFSMIVHCWRFDAAKIKYLELVEPQSLEGDLDVDTARQLLRSEAKRKHFFSAFLALAIMFQMYFFVRGSEKKSHYNFSDDDRRQMRTALEPIIHCWSFLGEGHHNTLMIIGTLLASFTPYGFVSSFLIILIPFNLWWLYCEFKFWQTYQKTLIQYRLLTDV